MTHRLIPIAILPLALTACGSNPVEEAKATIGAKFCSEQILSKLPSLPDDAIEETCGCAAKDFVAAGIGPEEARGARKEEVAQIVMDCASDAGLLDAVEEGLRARYGDLVPDELPTDLSGMGLGGDSADGDAEEDAGW